MVSFKKITNNSSKHFNHSKSSITILNFKSLVLAALFAFAYGTSSTINIQSKQGNHVPVDTPKVDVNQGTTQTEGIGLGISGDDYSATRINHLQTVQSSTNSADSTTVKVGTVTTGDNSLTDTSTTH